MVTGKQGAGEIGEPDQTFSLNREGREVREGKSKNACG
jgi:hypothetical protein